MMTNGQALELVEGIDDSVLPKEAKKLIKSALEMQTAARPLERKKTDAGIHYLCPKCGTHLGSRGKVPVILFEKRKFCSCGQKLDWSSC